MKIQRFEFSANQPEDELILERSDGGDLIIGLRTPLPKLRSDMERPATEATFRLTPRDIRALLTFLGVTTNTGQE